MDSNLDDMMMETEMIVPVSIEFPNDIKGEDLDLLCRLCGNSSHQLMSIFSGDGAEHNLPEIIKEHLPVQVSENDELPLSICYQCASTLISWHELYYACKDADLRLKELCARMKLQEAKPKVNLSEVQYCDIGKNEVDADEVDEIIGNDDTVTQPEIIIPHEVCTDNSLSSNDECKTRSIMISKMFQNNEESSHDNQSFESNIPGNRYSRANHRLPTQEPSLSRVTNRKNESYNPLCQKCVICDADVRNSGNNDLLCSTCLQDQPDLLKLLAFENDVPENLHKYLTSTPQKGAYLQCDVCAFQCEPSSCAVFDEHNATHRKAAVKNVSTSGGRMQCALCKKEFAKKLTLIRHLKNHEKKIFSCNLCSSAFKTSLQLKTHRKRHARTSADSTLIYCEVCKKYFKTKKGFAYHQQKICVQIKCYVCNTSFASQSLLQEHVRAEHDLDAKQPKEDIDPNAESKKINCRVCGKAVTHAVLPRHMILHTEERPFTCDMCGKQFKRKHSLQDHIMIEMGMKNYVCDICGMKFLKQGYLNKHVRYHKLNNGEYQGFACEQCGKKFSEKWRLGVHQRAVHKGGRFASCKCDICGELFAERYMVKMHKHKEHNGEVFQEYQCNVCDKKFLEKWMLKSHQRNTHRSGVRKMYCELCGRSDHMAQNCSHRHALQAALCMLCGDAFPSNIALKEHVTSAHNFAFKAESNHEPPAEENEQTSEDGGDDSKKNIYYVCAGCGKHFINKIHLKTHELQDNCYKPLKYDCTDCGKSFTSKFTLSNHTMIHKKASSALPFRCEFCGKEFATDESLQSHLSLEKVCLLCDAVCPCNDQLKSHVFGEHNDEDADESSIAAGQLGGSLHDENDSTASKPFECKLCGKKFMRKQAMKNHLFAEMNLRRYACEFCDKSYNYYSHLKEHLVSSHGEKEFLCGYCGKDFPTKKRFRDHVTLHSDEKPFTCECGQAFKLSRYLNKHKKNCKAPNLSMIEETYEIFEKN